MKNLIALTLLAFTIAGCSGCKKGGFNVFSVEDDKNFGAQMETEIASDPAQFPVLSQSQYPQAYAYLNRMRDTILASGQLTHANDFLPGNYTSYKTTTRRTLSAHPVVTFMCIPALSNILTMLLHWRA
jgi:hypothetical protein